MRSLFDIRKLCVSVGKQTCHIYSLPRYHEAIRPWTEKLGIPWHGEGLGGISLTIMEKLMKPKRETITCYVKHRILKAQGHKCNLCGERLVNVEFDHIVPVSLGGTELQALCVDCHKMKTIREATSGRVWQPFTSSFNTDAYRQFASEVNPRTPPVNIAESIPEKRDAYCSRSDKMSRKCIQNARLWSIGVLGI